MPIILRKLHTRYDLNRTQDRKVISIKHGTYGNLVTIATRYVADAYCPKEDHAKCKVNMT